MLCMHQLILITMGQVYNNNNIINADFSGPTIMKSIPKFIYKSAVSTELQLVYTWDPVPPGVR